MSKTFIFETTSVPVRKQQTNRLESRLEFDFISCSLTTTYIVSEQPFFSDTER